MRALLALLLLANLGFFALARGWLEPYVGLSTQHDREPQRWAAQLNAASVRVLDKASAGSALAGATSAPLCLQAGPFTAEQIDAAEAALAPAQWPGLVLRRVDDTPAAAETTSASAARDSRAWLRVEAADTAQRERLLGWPLGTPGSGFAPCPKVP